MTGVRLATVAIGWPHEPWRQRAMRELRRLLDDGSDALRRYTTGFLDYSDWNRLGQWPNERRAWQGGARERAATHVIVLNDDVHPCRGFLEAVVSIAEQDPEQVYCFLGNRKASRAQAAEAGTRWITSYEAAWGGGVLMPKALVPALVSYADLNVPAENPYGDARIAWFMLARQQRMWLTAPSLMQHVGAGRSALPAGVALNSTACDFPGFDFDARSIDWSDRSAPVEDRIPPKAYTVARAMPAELRERAGHAWLVEAR